MKKNLLSSKRLYLYIISSMVIFFDLFVLIMNLEGSLKGLYKAKTCQSYYLFSFMLISAVGYTIDMQTKKEAGLIVMIAQPIFSFCYLFLCLLTGGITGLKFSLLSLALIVFIGLGIWLYKKIMPKILGIKMGYQNLLLIYLIVHLTLVLFTGFYFMK